ncbi:MAG: hypothetical protein H6575_11445 [Lewinellaceae bacterium]|nr:hypothetical protein [Lewinellaceae bacterium]
MQREMKRVLVLGSGGSGKTTFSGKLAKATGLPLHHLDAHYWRADWVATPEPQWRERVAALVGQDEWIIDGSYGGTLDLRIPRADAIFFLDISKYRCLWNILLRRIKYARFTGKSRPGMAPGCQESIWLSFLIWVWRYPVAKKPGVLHAIQTQKRTDANVYIFRSYREMDVFLSHLKNGAS